MIKFFAYICAIIIGSAVADEAIDANTILMDHNTYRSALQIQHLIWNGTLQSHAQEWANSLTRNNQFEHSSQRREGENLWMGTSGSFSFTAMVTGWGNEKEFFQNGIFPNVSPRGWHTVGHYTQMIWRNTNQVGCGGSEGKGK